MTLQIKWEDFSSKDPIFEDLYEIKVIAKRVTVNINDYTQADTFSAEIDYKSFPFDPRCIRALGCTIHIEDKGQVFKPDNRLNMIVPSDENIVFSGFADEESLDFDDMNRVVKFEGRDFTGLLIDAPYPGKTLDLGKPINQVARDMLDLLPAAEKIVVVNRTDSAELPTLAKYAPGFQPLGTDRSGKKKESYWDVLQDIVGRAGLVAFIELDKLVITKPRAIYGDTRPINFIYGRNLKSLTYKRKLGRQKGINIIVRSIDLEGKNVLEAKIPLEAKDDWLQEMTLLGEEQTIEKVGADGQIKEEKAPYHGFNVPNIASKDQLIEIGQGLYEEIGRQQIDGHMKTLDMCILQNKVRFDLVKVRNGTPIQIDIDQGDMQGIKRLADVTEREKFLIARCYPKNIARAFARTLGKYKTRFYTKSVEFTLDQENGFELNIEFINFIELGNKGIT